MYVWSAYSLLVYGNQNTVSDSMKSIITTRHNKAQYLTPVFKKIGMNLEAYEGFDTDSLGSFCQTVERKSPPEACALTKARIACDATGAPFGIGSEGSFGGGPYSSFFNWNQEVLCFYDQKADHAIYAYAEGPVGLESISFSSHKALTNWVNRFPGQRWMWLQAESVTKGLTCDALIEHARCGDIKVGDTISPDLRAMYSPIRQILLTEVAKDLCRRLQSFCPECHAPDFVVNKHKPGLPCGICSAPTAKTHLHVFECARCGYTKERQVAEFADPFYCGICNP